MYGHAIICCCVSITHLRHSSRSITPFSFTFHRNNETMNPNQTLDPKVLLDALILPGRPMLAQSTANAHAFAPIIPWRDPAIQLTPNPISTRKVPNSAVDQGSLIKLASNTLLSNYSTVHTRDPNPPSFSTLPRHHHHRTAKVPRLLHNPPSNDPPSSLPSPGTASHASRLAGVAEFSLCFDGRISDHSFLPPAVSCARITDGELKHKSSSTRRSSVQGDRPHRERSALSASGRPGRQNSAQVFSSRFPLPGPPSSPPARSDSEASFDLSMKPTRPSIVSRHSFSSATTSGAEADHEDSDAKSDGGLKDAMLQSQLRKMLHRTGKTRPAAFTLEDRAISEHHLRSISSLREAESPSSARAQATNSRRDHDIVSLLGQRRSHHRVVSIGEDIQVPNTLSSVDDRAQGSLWLLL